MEQNVVDVKRSLLVLASALVFSHAALANEAATDIVEPIIAQQTIDVDMHSADWEIGLFAGVANIDGGSSNAIAGIRGAYHLTDNFFIEGSYAVTNHSPEVTYLNGVIGYNVHQKNYVTSDLTMQSSIFIVAGGGYTEVGDAEYKTIVGGAGYRLMITDALSLRLDLRGHFHHQLDNNDEWAIDAEATAGVSYFF